MSKTAYNRSENNLSEWLNELIMPNTGTNSYSASYDWDPFKSDVPNRDQLRLAGSVKVNFRAAIDKPTAILSAMLVDIGEDRRLSTELTVIE